MNSYDVGDNLAHNTRDILGYVIAPEGKEATLEACYFWAPPERRVEKTLPVVIECEYADGEVSRFYGVVDEVGYVENADSIHHDREAKSLPGGGRGPVDIEGTAYYKVDLLCVEPEAFLPPLGGARVYEATNAEAAHGYGFDQVKQGIPVGLLKAGARKHAGPVIADTAYLLGENGAHLSVGGISGVATKSSALLVTTSSVVQTAARQRKENPAAQDNLHPVPLFFSVKGTDMLWLDKESRPFRERPERAEHWREMGLEPRPFRNARFFVPGRADNPLQPRPVVARGDLIGYSWGLADVVERGLLRYLFAAEDTANQNFSFLLGLWEKRLTVWRNGRRTLKGVEEGYNFQRDRANPQTFAELVDLIEEELNSKETQEAEISSRMNFAHIGTIQAFYRRLKKLEYEGKGVLAWDQTHGRPPEINLDPRHEIHVIDIATLAAAPDIQRFVISAMLNELVEERMDPNAPHGVRYLVGLDELNRWAPKGTTDATTKLFEKIAGEMRSMGIILLGAQQFGSQVSRAVRENASCVMLGRTSAGELSDELYRDISAANKRMITRLQPGEQLLSVPSMRVPAHLSLPFPAWAMRYEDVWEADAPALENDGEEDDGPLFSYSGAGLDDLGI